MDLLLDVIAGVWVDPSFTVNFEVCIDLSLIAIFGIYVDLLLVVIAEVVANPTFVIDTSSSSTRIGKSLCNHVN